MTTTLTWFDLEKRFRELEDSLQFMRIDGQTGAAGEYWRLAGGPSNDATRRFNAVAAMASARLFQDFASEVNKHSELKSESDPVVRWYKALKFIGGRYKEDHYGEQINDDGSSGGFIFTGYIPQPASASVTLCMELASRTENPRGLHICRPEPAPPRLTVAAETNCRDWLVEQMKSPKATTKPNYQTKATEEFPGLSAKSFGRAWDNARKEPTTHPSWQKRGPIPSL